MKNSVILTLFILLIQNIFCEGGDLKEYAIILVMLALIIGFYLICFLPYIIIDMINKKNELIPPKLETHQIQTTETNPINENEIDVKVNK